MERFSLDSLCITGVGSINDNLGGAGSLAPGRRKNPGCETFPPELIEPSFYLKGATLDGATDYSG